MPPKYPEQRDQIFVRLYSLGLHPDRLMKIGAFVVAFGLFETRLERAVWALTETNVAGSRPFTDKVPAAKWLEPFALGNPKLSAKCNAVLHAAAGAAEDLMDYRHTLVHGHLLPLGGTPMFLRNPAWNKEVRNKPVGDAHIEEPMLDLAIVCAWTLFTVASMAEEAMSTPAAAETLEGLEGDVRRTCSYANELRHLTALMNSEKY